MDTIEEFLSRTRSAASKTLEAIDSYREVLGEIPVCALEIPVDADASSLIRDWMDENEEAIKQSRERQRAHAFEQFAVSCLAGTLLQLGCQAVRRFGRVRPVPCQWEEVVKGDNRKFLAGRLIRGVPAGLIVLAGRNQHMHSDDEKLRDLPVSVFESIAQAHGIDGASKMLDPMFDLANPKLASYAANVSGLIGWRNPNGIEKYEADILEIVRGPNGSRTDRAAADS